MPTAITDLAKSILDNPIRIEITPQSTTVERIDQKIYFVERRDKLSLLRHILKQKDATSVIVFSRTKHGADDVVDYLGRNSVSVAAIHGDKSQEAREKALINFREGKIRVLVATDIAARGIDIPAISHVINYDIPSDPESYVHRIGRTARAGRQGIAISFCDPHDDTLLLAVEKAINYKIPVDDSHPFSGKAKPAHQEKREEKTNSNQKYKENNNMEKRDNKKQPQRRENKQAKPKKKSSIFSFITDLFKPKKAATKPQHVKKEEQKYREKPQHKPYSKPHHKTTHAQNQKPARDERREEKERPTKTDRERPVRTGEKPVITTFGRKISSGKKE